MTLLAAAAVLAGGLLITAVTLTRHAASTDVADEKAVMVEVIDAPDCHLQIRFPGRAMSGNPPGVTLPAGLIEFTIHSECHTHPLVIDSIHAFQPTPDQPGTVTRRVRLSHGTYNMHCTIPGHAQAGEQALLRVT